MLGEVYSYGSFEDYCGDDWGDCYSAEHCLFAGGAVAGFPGADGTCTVLDSLAPFP